MYCQSGFLLSTRYFVNFWIHFSVCKFYYFTCVWVSNMINAVFFTACYFVNWTCAFTYAQGVSFVSLLFIHTRYNLWSAMNIFFTFPITTWLTWSVGELLFIAIAFQHTMYDRSCCSLACYSVNLYIHFCSDGKLCFTASCVL